MLSENLIDDLVVSILSRVPAKSLLRLKAVCKSWNELIQNQQFIYEHHKTRNNDCLFIKRDGCRRRDRVFSFIYSQSPTSIRVEDSPRLQEKDIYIDILPPCNGIFCVLFRFSVVLWNPTLRQVKALPQCPKATRQLSPDFMMNNEWRNAGLSFDPKSNAYKVVLIRGFRRDIYTGEFLNEVVVWEPGTKVWRQIDNAPPIPIGNARPRQLNLKGKCYWRSRSICCKSDAIISFDMFREVFQVIPLPDPNSVDVKKDGCFPYWYKAFVLNESIALLSLPLQHNEKCFEVWLMRENSDQVFWSKYITVEQPIPHIEPLGFWKNGELILGKERTELAFLNMSTGEIVNTEVKVNFCQQVHVYNESLVSINELV